MSSKRTLFIIEIAMFTAMALVLDIVPFLSFKIWAQGGSISFAMIPIFIVAFRWGLKGGLLSGLLWGILQVAVGDGVIYYIWQGVIEYGLAFTVLGFAGIFASLVKQSIKNQNRTSTFMYITCGVLTGSLLRFAAHWIAGAVFFAKYLPDGWNNVWFYSFVYNGSYMLPSFIICTVLVFYLFHKQPRVLLHE